MFEHFAQFTCATPAPDRWHIVGPSHSRGEPLADAIDKSRPLCRGDAVHDSRLSRPNQIVRIGYNSGTQSTLPGLRYGNSLLRQRRRIASVRRRPSRAGRFGQSLGR
jgi:hypothetical protein